MPETKHTAEPWWVEHQAPGVTSKEGTIMILGPAPAAGGDPVLIATVEGGEARNRLSGSGLAAAKANAELLAQAPPLLRMLEALAFEAERMRCACTIAQIESGHLVECTKPVVLDIIQEANAVIERASGATSGPAGGGT